MWIRYLQQHAIDVFGQEESMAPYGAGAGRWHLRLADADPFIMIPVPTGLDCSNIVF